MGAKRLGPLTKLLQGELDPEFGPAHSRTIVRGVDEEGVLYQVHHVETEEGDIGQPTITYLKLVEC